MRIGPHGEHARLAPASAVVSRLTVVWIDPMHLSSEEAEAWIRKESARLLELDEVERLELVRVERASDAQAQLWDWLLEVHLLPGVGGAACVDRPLFAEWFGDLRLLGMRPVVLFVGERTVMGSDPG
jgi:hypothetical protein